jgi:hypothetical protein
LANGDPWNKSEATEAIRKMAKSERLGLIYKLHARERLSERNLIMSDVLFVLKNGFVHNDAVKSTREGYHKYAIECRSPNSGGREVRVIAIPDLETCKLKIVTVMWVDEKSAIAGTIVRNEDEVPLH